MARRLALALACGLTVAACGQGATTSGGTLEPPANDGVVAQIVAGVPFTVTFDACSDEGWTGDTDPLGTIKCGEIYAVTYSPATAQFSATGLNEADGMAATVSAGGANAASGEVSIWGAVFLVGGDGVVTTIDGAPVGRASIPG